MELYLHPQLSLNTLIALKTEDIGSHLLPQQPFGYLSIGLHPLIDPDHGQRILGDLPHQQPFHRLTLFILLTSFLKLYFVIQCL